MKETKPIAFKEANGVLYGSGAVVDLPVFRNEEEVISYWRIPFLKRLRLLWGGRVWLRIQGKTHPPACIDTECFE